MRPTFSSCLCCFLKQIQQHQTKCTTCEDTLQAYPSAIPLKGQLISQPLQFDLSGSKPLL
jgi:hypothetical protein